MPHRLLLGLSGLLLILLVAGCATLSREECLRGDWYQIGVSDGQAGHAFERIDQHRRACQGTATVDEASYRAGRDAGLVSYCTPLSGYHVASNEHGYANVCPAETAPQFLQGYALGQQVADAQRRVRSAENRIRDIDREIAEQERERDEAERILVDSGDQNARLEARLELQSIRYDIDRLELARRAVEDDLLDARTGLQGVQESTFAQLQSFIN